MLIVYFQVFTDNEERPGEKRIYSMLFDNKHERLLTGSSVIDSWPLTRAVQDTMQVPHTHDRPLSQVCFLLYTLFLANLFRRKSPAIVIAIIIKTLI